MPRSTWKRYGLHPERGKETVRRTLELVAGHDLNHLDQIRAIPGNTAGRAKRGAPLGGGVQALTGAPRAASRNAPTRPARGGGFGHPLGVPLHADVEGVVAPLDRLDHAVAASRGHAESRGHAVHRLVVERIHDRLASAHRRRASSQNAREEGPRFDLHGMLGVVVRFVLFLVLERPGQILRNVLEQGTPNSTFIT